MSCLGGKFTVDFVVSVATPQITSSAGKRQVDDEWNNDHLFFHNMKQEEKPKKTQLQNYHSDQLEILPNKTFLLIKQ